MANYRDIKVKSFHGTEINDGTTYESGLSPGRAWGLPEAEVQFVPRRGAWPLIGTLNRPGTFLSLLVRIVASDIRTARDDLLRLFDPEQETPHKLVVTDYDGTDDRFVECLCSSIEPIDLGGQSAVDLFRVSLAIHGDVRWRSIDLNSIVGSSYEWTGSGSGTDEYYLEASGGGDPGISEPDLVYEDSDEMTEGTAGSLESGEWDWASDTVYVRLDDGTNPDDKSDGYVEYECLQSDTWSGVNTDGATHDVTVSGTDDAYPIYELTSSSVPSNFLYMRYVVVEWNSDYAASQYPIRLPSLNTTNRDEFQKNCEDLRVYVDGSEVDRWVVDPDTDSTYTWLNVDFEGQRDMTLDGAIDADDTAIVLEVDAADELPSQGYVEIGSEVLYYTHMYKVTPAYYPAIAYIYLSEINRGVWGTTASSHGDGDAVKWIQHEVRILYGHSTIGAPDVDDDYKPMFDYTDTTNSTNSKWRYTSFYEPGNTHRSAAWVPNRTVTDVNTEDYNAGCWVDSLESADGTYDDMSLWIQPSGGFVIAAWALWNPCGIVNVQWGDGSNPCRSYDDWGEYYQSFDYHVRDKDWVDYQFEVTSLTGTGSWENSDANDGDDDGIVEEDASNWSAADFIGVKLKNARAADDVSHLFKAEIGLVQVQLGDTPSVSFASSEISNARMDITLTNQAPDPDESIDVLFNPEVDEILEIDTYDERITYKKDDTIQNQALSVGEGVRDRWLRLLPGTNTLEFESDDPPTMDIVVKWRDRYY